MCNFQAKNVVQAEIDAAPELIDFFRFNAAYALELEQQQPLNPDPNIVNTIDYRGLEVNCSWVIDSDTGRRSQQHR